MMEYINLALGQWSFFAASAILYAINNSVKKLFPSPDVRKYHAAIWAFLPLYPIALGGLFGALNGSPLPGTIKDFGKLAGPLYYACAGLVAIYARDIIKTYIKFMMPERYDKSWDKEDSMKPPPPVVPIVEENTTK